MLGLIVRVLPFWVREPLLILVGSVFGVGVTIRALYESNWLMAGLGVAVLAVTAFRIRTVRHAWRARRSAVAAAAAPQTGPLAGPAPAPAAPAPQKKEPNTAAQVFLALALVGALVGAVWLAPRVTGDATATSRKPATCSDHAAGKKLPKAYALTPGAVTGDDLCKALNRSDLAALLGTPRETPLVAYGNSGTASLTADKVAASEARVQFDTYTVEFSATYNHMTIALYTKVLAPQTLEHRADKVLGRPAVFTSDHLMQFRFGGPGSTGPATEGPLARTLTVALDRKDPGGTFDFTVWSESGAALPEDDVILGIAEKILPTLPASR
ncbi:hypothetical protein K388_02609 [Streptomyces sp. KhCrAH-43]|uniref:DUF6215 domain-containing protein n=1 Tax=unclassified Streptomyces TaxID=2593676 RepID=UPI00036EB487|nr:MULTISPECIES: DUF6215 domain-containing protein [unclassified Streptomyces]MYS36597.1 hypothetical protein [Streptomyces sp. SID4920]MYX69068.1 hypothetical protein [Streptomyces sp. SID8373]RAJ61923.1 hypothetical protein K388_02609 [Streptomyces sp. KhCrAH-43]